MCERGVGDRTELQHIDHHSYGHQRFFPVLLGCSTGDLGPSLSGCFFFLYRILSPTDLVSKLLNRGPEGSLCWVLAFSTASYLQLVWSPNWLNFQWTALYNSSTPTFFLWVSQIALIQPIHGQGYTLLFLDRMHLLFKQVHFLFWQPGRVVGQYTTIFIVIIWSDFGWSITKG